VEYTAAELFDAAEVLLHGMQWTPQFFEVVIVASCNEHLSLPKNYMFCIHAQCFQDPVIMRAKVG